MSGSGDAKPAAGDDDDDFDLFGSDDEEAAAEAEKLKEERLVKKYFSTNSLPPIQFPYTVPVTPVLLLFQQHNSLFCMALAVILRECTRYTVIMLVPL